MVGFEYYFEFKVNGSYFFENIKEYMFEVVIVMFMCLKLGEDWYYFDLGYFLFGLVIELVVNMDYFDFMY